MYLINNYKSSDSTELLRLLLLLQLDYFRTGASALVNEVEKEHDTSAIYKRYITELEAEIKEDTAIIFLAHNETGQAIGFIIGRIGIDSDLVLEKFGIVEDWFVDESSRKQGVGIALYIKLEQWFKEKDCKHLQSGTWAWNKGSIDVHHKLGFETTEVKFIKKI